MTIELRQKSQWLENDVETVISLFLNRIGGGDGVLLESVEPDGRWGRFSLAAGNFLLSAVCRKGLLALTINDGRFQELEVYNGWPYFEGLRRVMASINIQGDPNMPLFPAITRSLYGYIGYGAASLLNVKLSAPLPPEEAEVFFALPGEAYLFDHNYNQLAQISILNGQRPEGEKRKLGPIAGPGPISSSLNRAEFLKAVVKAKKLIDENETRGINLSTCFSAPFKDDLFEAYRRLRHLNPSPYMFFLRQPENDLAFSSTEVLISCANGHLKLNPTAGSRPQGRDLSEDGLFEEELFTPHEQADHSLLVDLARRELESVAQKETVKLERFMEVESFSHDIHLSSHLSGQLADNLDAIDIISAFFPSATVSGLSKIKAIELLAGLEPGSRGPYGGALGWLGLDRDSINLDLGLTTRGFWARGGKIFWRSGVMISPYSEPEMKWRECLNRAEAILKALGPDNDQNPAKILLDGKTEEKGDDKSIEALQQDPGFQLSPAKEPRPPVAASSSLSAPASLPFIMESVANGQDLSQEYAAQLFSRLMDGELRPAQAGAFLMGLRAKGETPLEMAEAAAAVLARAITPPPLPGPVLDVVGTGGDGRNSFNCSSGAALVMAGMGYKVVKHGNRSVSSRCGSADVLELLGAELDEAPETVPIRLKERNFAFLFAPKYHPSFKYIMPVRKELGIRTLFNVLGPLVNPAKPYHSFLGAHNRDTAALLAGALARMNTGFSAAVYGAGGYDEMTAMGPATVFLVEGDQVRETVIDPAKYGFNPINEEELSIRGPQEGVAVLRELLAGRGPKAMRDMLILNVAMAIYVVKGGQDFDRCLAEARSGVEGGAGASVLPG